MQNFVLSPFLSTVISVFLLMGCYELGRLLVEKFTLKNVILPISILELQYITFGLVFLLIILFPLVAFLSHAKIILQSTSLILFVLGINFIFKIEEIIKKIFFFQKKNFYAKLFLFFLLLFFFLGLAPLTSADVLDYHTGVAINIIRFSKFILLPEWFTSLQAGQGEILIALGLSAGSEQFGSLVQFSSILSISGIYLKFCEKQNIFNSKFFLVITILSCPILIFLLSGNKPQIFYSSLILFSLALNYTKQINRRNSLICFLLINLFLCISVVGKFSFGLSAFLVWIYTVINFVSRKNMLILIGISFGTFIVIYLPFLIWKFMNLGGNIFNYLINPFPIHMPGYENFLLHNKGSQEIPFPNFLFYTSLTRATEFLGFNSFFFIILLFYYNHNKFIKSILLISTLFILFSNLYASPSARYYLDPILWTGLAVSTLKNFKMKKILQLLFYPQIFIVFGILIYSVIIFLPGSFSKNQYTKIKNNYAYMYSGFDWLNNNIPDNSSVIIMNRPISQYKDFAISGSFNYFTNLENSKFYKEKIKKYKPEYLVYFGSEPEFIHLKGCAVSLYKKKINVGKFASRNPFNKDVGQLYNAYIYKFDYSKLPKC